MDGEEKESDVLQAKTVDGKQFHLIKPGIEGVVDGGYFAKGWNFTVELAQSPILEGLLARVATEVRQHPGDERYALDAVYRAVDGAFSNRNVREVNAFDARLKRSGKTPSLEDFANAGVGDCAQTTVASALLVEKLNDMKLLPGTAFIQEKQIETEFYAEGHVWLDYRSPKVNEVLDVVRKFKGDPISYQKVIDDLETEIRFSN